jgi:hypothetical protein
MLPCRRHPVHISHPCRPRYQSILAPRHRRVTRLRLLTGRTSVVLMGAAVPSGRAWAAPLPSPNGGRDRLGPLWAPALRSGTCQVGGPGDSGGHWRQTGDCCARLSWRCSRHRLSADPRFHRPPFRPQVCHSSSEAPLSPVSRESLTAERRPELRLSGRASRRRSAGWGSHGGGRRARAGSVSTRPKPADAF